MGTEVIKGITWEAYARRIEKRNLSRDGHSLTAVGIMDRARPFIVEIRNRAMIVKKGWRKAMRDARIEKEGQ